MPSGRLSRTWRCQRASRINHHTQGAHSGRKYNLRLKDARAETTGLKAVAGLFARRERNGLPGSPAVSRHHGGFGSFVLRDCGGQQQAHAQSTRPTQFRCGPWCPSDRQSGVYNSTCSPSSTTRLVGIWKKSVAFKALRFIQTNNSSRQRAIPGRSVLISVSLDKKKEVLLA
jgi:hypothetical protein